MALPEQAVGYGCLTADSNANVFACGFKYALSSTHTFECYDNTTGVWGNTDDGNYSVAYDIFTGDVTTNGSESLINFVATDGGAPTLPVWKLTEATGTNTGQINRMKGTTNYVTSGGTMSSTTSENTFHASRMATFNMCIEVPFGATTAWDMNFDVLCRYTYTGTDPAPAFHFNDALSGTEGVPLWTEITATYGIKHARTGSSSGSAFANIPASDFVQAALYNVDGVVGINDCTSGGQFAGATAYRYDINVDLAAGTDTFQWRKTAIGATVGAYTTTGVSMTGSAQTLDNGVTVTFAATTGHNVSDYWCVFAGSEDTVEGWVVT